MASQEYFDDSKKLPSTDSGHKETAIKVAGQIKAEPKK